MADCNSDHDRCPVGVLIDIDDDGDGREIGTPPPPEEEEAVVPTAGNLWSTLDDSEVSPLEDETFNFPYGSPVGREPDDGAAVVVGEPRSESCVSVNGWCGPAPELTPAEMAEIFVEATEVSVHLLSVGRRSLGRHVEPTRRQSIFERLSFDVSKDTSMEEVEPTELSERLPAKSEPTDAEPAATPTGGSHKPDSPFSVSYGIIGVPETKPTLHSSLPDVSFNWDEQFGNVTPETVPYRSMDQLTPSRNVASPHAEEVGVPHRHVQSSPEWVLSPQQLVQSSPKGQDPGSPSLSDRSSVLGTPLVAAPSSSSMRADNSSDCSASPQSTNSNSSTNGGKRLKTSGLLRPGFTSRSSSSSSLSSLGSGADYSGASIEAIKNGRLYGRSGQRPSPRSSLAASKPQDRQIGRVPVRATPAVASAASAGVNALKTTLRSKCTESFKIPHAVASSATQRSTTVNPSAAVLKPSDAPNTKVARGVRRAASFKISALCGNTSTSSVSSGSPCVSPFRIPDSSSSRNTAKRLPEKVTPGQPRRMTASRSDSKLFLKTGASGDKSAGLRNSVAATPLHPRNKQVLQVARKPQQAGGKSKENKLC